MVAVLGAAVLPLFLAPAGDVMGNLVLAAAYVGMALGLNVIVGFAGLLDLGYVAFFAIGAYTAGYFGSGYWHETGFSFLVEEPVAGLPGIHLNFVFVFVLAIAATAVAGVIIGVPTLRLRGDYIAIVTLAFGEIVSSIVVQRRRDPRVRWHADRRRQGDHADRQDRPPVSRAVRGVEPAAVVLVRARARPAHAGRQPAPARLAPRPRVAGDARGRGGGRERRHPADARPSCWPTAPAPGSAALFGAFLASFLNTVTAVQFEFSFSIFVLAMVVVGGLGSVWGVVGGAVVLSALNSYVLPDLLGRLPGRLGFDFDLSQVSYGIYGVLLVIMVLLRPAGLWPERR